MVLFLCAVVLALLVFLPELNILVLGAAFAIFFHPIYVRILRGMPRHEGLAASLTLLIALVVIVVPLIFFGYALFAEAQGFYLHLTAGGIPSLENLITTKLGSVVSNFNQSSNSTFTLANFDLGQYVTQAVGTIVSNTGRILSSIGLWVWTLFLAFFVFLLLLSLEEGWG